MPIDSDRFANRSVCQDSGLDFDTRTPPVSPAMGRNWPPTQQIPADRPSTCWKNTDAITAT